MADDDEFEYEDDYSFSDDGHSDDEMRIELELDDLRLELQRNSADALNRVREIARDQSSRHCITASMELMQLSPNVDNFRLLTNAIINGPMEKNSQEKLSFLEQAWSQLQRSSLQSREAVTSEYKHLIGALKSAKEDRLYFKSLLLMVSFASQAGDYETSSALLHREVPAALSETATAAWAVELKAETAILEIECTMLQEDCDLLQLYKCIDNVNREKMHLLPHKLHIVEEAKARLSVYTGQFHEAKTLLKSSVRGYEETLNLQLQQEQLVRSVTWLILVSVIQDKSPFNLHTDLPTLHTLRNESSIVLALQISQAFADRDARKYRTASSQLEASLRHNTWKFGVAILFTELNDAFMELQVSHILSSYSRIRWVSLQEKVYNQTGVELTLTFIRRMLLDHVLVKDYRINSVENTIELAHAPDRPPMESTPRLPKRLLPKAYHDREARESQSVAESSILNKWQGDTSTALTGRTNAKVSRLSNESHNNNEVLKALQISLDQHRESMLN